MNRFERHKMKIRGVLSSKDLDAILLMNYRSVKPSQYDYTLYYLSNLLGFFPFCFLIMTEDECGIWVDNGDIERAKQQTSIENVWSIESESGRYSTKEFAKIAANQLKELIGTENIKVGVNGDHLPSSVSISLIEEGLQLEDITLDLEKSMLIKDERELALLRKAAKIADKGVEKVMNTVQKGVTERELSVLAECEMRERGAECFWWPSIISSGPEAELWADSPNNRKIRKGDLLWMDFTPVYKGYAADIARAFIFEEANTEQLNVFNLAEKVLKETASTLRDGVTIREVMNAAAQIVRGSPYESNYTGPGHMIGLYNSVYPVYLTSIPMIKALPPSVLNMRLSTGMTVAIEIIFTVPGLGGVRLEDDYLITENLPERLTKAPITATLSS